ncbi:polyphenol oxidase family protein [Roseococcus sp. SDR]|uniref:polyphenol oxidase family protein n=1 Tax=Roseococcus sp. SDR TaxID=2835532 RepID=UPI001BCC53D5|nr:polyphenol oxidase family protein [Roseococcus sp. SDR]MBS7791397.1 laccase domain-containing protein [Roseococcus sp. SDR]MBV1846711.1 polyphenol oxidase family protein [Roseococcus sp. SDR]
MAEFLTHAGLAARHGFFTRRGGVSAGAYATLNCGLRSEDDPAAVAENRARAARALGAEPRGLRGLRQVHGPAVVEAGAPWESLPEADAMVTRTPGVALGIITADCAPVLFHDGAAGVIGAAHAGWKGAVSGVLEATIAAMEALGAERGRITAVVGPCIAQASYEVRSDLRDAVGDARFFAPGRDDAHFQFDLPGYCVARLEAAGVAGEALGLDTLADEARFFSHRRRTLAGGGPLGHQLSAIML